MYRAPTFTGVDAHSHGQRKAIRNLRLFSREPCWPGRGDTSLPAAPLVETGDCLVLTSEAGDVGAGRLDDPLWTARRASAPAQRAGLLLPLLFPGPAAPSPPPRGFSPRGNRLPPRHCLGG